ncbi:phosphoadenosine phosphosulfate reductase [Sediminimonas sp.]|uniref:phosphoadenosine phosphosulfate reductase n=1 Tax=Sediminimonas sp. TaxID=2823379 RepID=UPI0025F10B10|nr:phosphoadenosine phosphosulfate reductase [Sediminimonas sp.]
MSDTPRLTETSLAGLGRDDWLNAVAGVIGPHGGLESLGPDHNAALVRAGDTLLVTFESIQGIAALSDTAHPLGWELAEAWGWSHLALISDGDTWFRDRAVYGYFDRLVDDGFFEEFDRVIYYGAGPCGYAAAAFSVAAPGARVLAVQPQATLDARLTEWDDRFVHMRRTSFSDRYGYAPDMLDAADHAFILYDPYETLDAMHATLFEAPNVTRLRLRNMGGAIQGDLIALDLLYPLVEAVADETLTRPRFAEILRRRRNHGPYIQRLMARLAAQDRPMLEMAVCRNALTRIRGPRIRRRLRVLEQKFAPPEDTDSPGDGGGESGGDDA